MLGGLIVPEEVQGLFREIPVVRTCCSDDFLCGLGGVPYGVRPVDRHNARG